MPISHSPPDPNGRRGFFMRIPRFLHYQAGWQSLLTFGAFLTLFMLVAVGKCGFWLMPNLKEQHTISQSLLVNLLPDANSHYLLTNYLQPLLFGLVGGHAFKTYIIYAALCALGFYAGFVWSRLNRPSNPTVGHLSLLAMGVFTVFETPAYWIGMDGLTLLLCLLIMLTLQTRWGLLFAALLSWQHFEQGMVGFLLLGGTLAIMVLAGKKPADLNALKWTRAVLLTMVAGKGLLALHFHLSHLQMGGDRYSYTKVYLPIWIKAWTDDWPSILFSLFGTGWLILIARYRKIWFIFPAVLVAFVLLMAIGDKTRVGTIVLFPVTMYVIFMNEEFWGFLNARWICALLILHLATPVCFFWLKAHGSLWRYSQVLVTNFIDSSQSFRNFDSWKPFVDENPPPTIFIKADYAPKTFAAAVLPSQIGRIEGTTRVATAGEAGFLTYGPYIILPPGSYLAKIFYSAEADSSGQTTGTWDVALPPPAAKEISRGELPPGSNRIHEIRFAIDRDVRIEIRTRATGKGRLTVEKVEIHPVSN